MVIYHSEEADLELLSLFSASGGEKENGSGAPLAKLTILHGDEVMRQLVCRTPTQHLDEPLLGLAKSFPGQESVAESMWNHFTNEKLLL